MLFCAIDVAGDFFRGGCLAGSNANGAVNALEISASALPMAVESYLDIKPRQFSQCLGCFLHCIAEAPRKRSRALESGRRRTRPNRGGCCDFFFNVFCTQNERARSSPFLMNINTPKGTQYGNDKETHPITLSPHRAPSL